jgi:hypothetical protein
LAPQKSKDKKTEVRRKIAKEAATLLYHGLEKEYKQAKQKAAANLGVHILPSNLEVALELDQVAGETEGPERLERLIQMRAEALQIMKVLASYFPVLIGSVWRGNIRRGSDIDIEAYHNDPEALVEKLRAAGLKVLRTQSMNTTERGEPVSSYHIYAESSGGYPVEIVIRPFEEANKKRICDTFGDTIKGLNTQDLEKLLKECPAKRFFAS